jgi:hypothetical protein
LSFAASLAHGLDVSQSDLLADDRAAALRLLRERTGDIHVIADNAGTELTMDLVLVDVMLRVLGGPVTLHVKMHPTFVSDATALDVHRFVRSGATLVDSPSDACLRCLERLAGALDDGRLTVREHWFWNGPESLWDMPDDLASVFSRARLVISKGDANYRRAVGDAVWPATTPFGEVVAYFPAPLFALRTLKSDPVVGLREGEAERLDADDPRWRFDGKRGVASLGGAGVTRVASGST